jgi:hypothetical protein
VNVFAVVIVRSNAVTTIPVAIFYRAAKTPTFFNDNPIISITGTRIRINSEDMEIARVSGMQLRTQQPEQNQHVNTAQNMHLHAPATPFLRQPPLPARRRQKKWGGGGGGGGGRGAHAVADEETGWGVETLIIELRRKNQQ